jgi:hypothetical protein
MTTSELIQDYVKAVGYCVSRMREHYREHDLLSGQRAGRIPKRGVIENGKISFFFHGIGCNVDTPDFSVDFDFGPDGRIGGFDAFRLSLFGASGFMQTGEVPTEEEIRVGLNRLQEQGVIVAPCLQPSPHLLYLAAGSNNANGG